MTGDIRSLKILVIDDEHDVADVTGVLLRANAIPNHVVYSAKEGLRALEQDPLINAVFSDITMPEMTGLHLTEVVRQLYPSMRILLTSGSPPSDMLSAHQNSCFFIAKPYRIEAVIEILTGQSKRLSENNYGLCAK